MKMINWILTLVKDWMLKIKQIFIIIMKYIKKFIDKIKYNEWRKSNDYVTPNVCFIELTNEVNIEANSDVSYDSYSLQDVITYSVQPNPATIKGELYYSSESKLNMFNVGDIYFGATVIEHTFDTEKIGCVLFDNIIPTIEIFREAYPDINIEYISSCD